MEKSGFAKKFAGMLLRRKENVPLEKDRFREFNIVVADMRRRAYFNGMCRSY